MKKNDIAILINSLIAGLTFLILINVIEKHIAWKTIFASLSFIYSFGITILLVIKKIKNKKNNAA